MSATGRKKNNTKDKQEKRDPYDFYPTPNWCVERFLEMAQQRLPIGDWIEPSAGDGAIIRSVKQFGRGLEKINWISIETQERFLAPLKTLSHTVWIGDYTKYDHSMPSAKVCITNPPYKLAESIVKHAQTQAECVVMLLRINFLASETRREWMSKNTPDIYVLPNRPSFRGKGTDATEYAWFLWDKQSSGKIFILNSTSKEIRQAEKRALKQK